MNDTALVGSLDEHLPQGWMSTRLSAVCEEVDKVEPERRHKIDFIYIDIGSIDNDAKIIASPKRILALEAPSRARQLVRSGDVLIFDGTNLPRQTSRRFQKLDGQIASTGFCVL